LKNTREKLINAAKVLILEKGYHNTNSNEIAKKAGVAVGSFYLYFSDKKGILLEILKNHLDEVDRDYFSKNIESMILFNDTNELIQALIKTAYFYFTRDSKLFYEANALIGSVPEIEALYKEHEKKMLAKTREMLIRSKDKLKRKDIDMAAVMVNNVIESLIQTIIEIEDKEKRTKYLNELSNMIHAYLFG
jgi:AcrR family transcriptional regulator